MHIVLTFTWPQSIRENSVCLSQHWGEPLYLCVKEDIGPLLLVSALVADGWIEKSEENVLLKAETRNVPEAAAYAPRSWKRLLYLSWMCQETAPGREMFIPSPNLAAPAILSLPSRVSTVYVEAEGADLRLVTVAGELAGLNELFLIFRDKPQWLGADNIMLSSRLSSLSYFKSANLLTKDIRRELSPLAVSSSTIRFETFRTHKGPRPVLRRRKLNLLRLAFKSQKKVSKILGLLEELKESGGAAEERALIDWLSSVSLQLKDYLELVEYGYLERRPTPGGMIVSLTEKGLFALVVSDEKEKGDAGQ